MPGLCFLFKPPSRLIWQEKGTLMETLNFYKMFLLFSALTPGGNFVLWIIFIKELVILTCHWNKLILDYYYSQNLAIFLCISPKENQWSPSNNPQDWTWFGPITTLTSFLLLFSLHFSLIDLIIPGMSNSSLEKRLFRFLNFFLNFVKLCLSRNFFIPSNLLNLLKNFS